VTRDRRRAYGCAVPRAHANLNPGLPVVVRKPFTMDIRPMKQIQKVHKCNNEKVFHKTHDLGQVPLY